MFEGFKCMTIVRCGGFTSRDVGLKQVVLALHLLLIGHKKCI